MEGVAEVKGIDRRICRGTEVSKLVVLGWESVGGKVDEVGEMREGKLGEMRSTELGQVSVSEGK